MGHRSRTEMFLSSLGIPQRKIQALFRGLSRLDARPSTAEEEIAHDALKLDELGARGVVRKILEGRREGMDFKEMAAAIEQAAGASLRTEEGEALARERRRIMLDFARQLIEEETEPR